MLKRLFIAIYLVAISSSVAFAAKPAIFFFDLESGPNKGGQDNKGSFVTIWGKNFGEAQKDSYITIDGGKADNYPVWTDTKVTFQLGPEASTGDIIVATKEGLSNGILFTVRDGDIYFVKTTGSDQNGWGTWELPWRTILRAKRYIAAGDIVYICDGVEQTAQDDYRAAVNLDSSGTPERPKALIAYPNAKVTVGSLEVERGFGAWTSGAAKGKQTSYWVISQMNIIGGTYAILSSDGFRIVGNKISTPKGDGPAAATEGGGSHVRILGNEYHNCGAPQASKLYHNIYINNHTGGEITDIEIGWNIIRDSEANRAIQIYSDGNGHADIANVAIHDNVICNVRGNAININNHATGEIKVYNNIFYKCARGPHPRDGITNYAGVLFGGGLGDYQNDATIYFYNNVLYDCGFAKSPEDSGLLLISRSFSGKAYVRNNIFYSNGERWQPYMVSGSKAPAKGSSGNLFYNGGRRPLIFIPFDNSWRVPSWDPKALNADPLFVDLKNHDFHLRANSPCINAGTDTSSIVKKDKDGVVRPQGKAVDVGVYEY